MKFKNIFFTLVIFMLLYSAPRFGKNYKGAEYRTKEAFKYGRFETSFIPAHRTGVISSFFTYHEFSGSTGWNEIDIEFIGRYDDIIQYNTITPSQRFHIRNQYLPFNPYEDFHTYAFEWTPDYVAWFIDGKEVYRQEEDFVPTLQYEQHLMMNIWNPVYEGWVGEWSEDYLPAFAYYDWASYASYTPDSGNTGTGNNFTLEWKDEFNEWNKDRWTKATHTFGGNQADFIPDNAVFLDGKLILCLTDDVNTGYTDNAKPAIIWARENYDNTVHVEFSEEMDVVSAEDIANYTIPGVEIQKAELSADKKSVLIFTNNYNPDLPYNLIINNISDDSETPNTMGLNAKTINQISPLNFPVKIDVGGTGFGDFMPDQEFDETTEYGFNNGVSRTLPQNVIISGTSEINVYRSQKRGFAKYRVRLPNDDYKLTLMMSENKFNEAGKRVFDIFVEDELIREDLDIFSEVGKFTAYEIKTDVELRDETLDIIFSEEVDSAALNGILIEQISTGVEGASSIGEKNFRIYQNYPNPFNGETKIKIDNFSGEKLLFKIYDLLGREIYSETINSFEDGNKIISWNGMDKAGKNVNSGIYFYRVAGNAKSFSRKMIYLK